jgi:hypothetical protein
LRRLMACRRLGGRIAGRRRRAVQQAVQRRRQSAQHPG